MTAAPMGTYDCDMAGSGSKQHGGELCRCRLEECHPPNPEISSGPLKGFHLSGHPYLAVWTIFVDRHIAHARRDMAECFRGESNA